ncbi:hypothetical protein E3N88_27531 [Mikania micrantha]|uniref:Uncharacterized protein n=1 Tax=Mikania micrantha TaxID=192012 RepID=A0A5N6MY09_9ASTR|nr:hypothetical protein E3N88_27531 [Mikania micrantha]
MMNIGENRARNRVPNCPESQNEENYKNVKVKRARRTRALRLKPNGHAGRCAWRGSVWQIGSKDQIHAKIDVLQSSPAPASTRRRKLYFYHQIFIFKATKHLDHAREHVYKS